MLELSSKAARGEVSWATRLRSGLGKTRSRLSGLFTDRSVDPALFEEIETALLASDAGAEATRFLLAALRERASQGATAGQLKTALRAVLLELLAPLEQTLDLSGKKPCIVMLAGVNGSGKTTSIGKLARYFQDQGRSVLLAAGDVGFASAKTYDLEVWAPGVGQWLEVSSSSTFTDFQARRASIRFRAGPGAKPEFVHTLNASGVALPRTIAALLETHLQADGSVIIPRALVPYVGMERLVPPASGA